jgi:acetyl-CoA C-acetyltransferase
MRCRASSAPPRPGSEGRFKNSVIPVKDINGLTILAKDEHMRPSTTMQSLAALKAVLRPDGEMGGFDAVAIQSHPEIEASTTSITPAIRRASSMARRRAARLKRAGKKAGLKPRAKIRAFANIGSEPAMMLTGPVDVTKKVLASVPA